VNRVYLRTIWEIGTCIKASYVRLKRLFEIQTLVGGKIMSALKNWLFGVSVGARMPLLGGAAAFPARLAGGRISWRAALERLTPEGAMVKGLLMRQSRLLTGADDDFSQCSEFGGKISGNSAKGCCIAFPCGGRAGYHSAKIDNKHGAPANQTGRRLSLNAQSTCPVSCDRPVAADRLSSLSPRWATNGAADHQ
jgi:hypothetical protein